MSESTTADPDSTAPNPTVDDLASTVAQLQDRVAELEARLDDLTDAADTTDDTASSDPREWLDVPADHRDVAVLEALTPGSTYRISDLRDAYHRETDIRVKETLRERTKSLLQASAFERVGNQRVWRYRPPGQALDTGAAPAETDEVGAD